MRDRGYVFDVVLERRCSVRRDVEQHVRPCRRAAVSQRFVDSLDVHRVRGLDLEGLDVEVVAGARTRTFESPPGGGAGATYETVKLPPGGGRLVPYVEGPKRGLKRSRTHR